MTLFTVGLILLSAATLIVGFIDNSLALIYVAIGAAFAACVILALSARFKTAADVRHLRQATAGGVMPLNEPSSNLGPAPRKVRSPGAAQAKSATAPATATVDRPVPEEPVAAPKPRLGPFSFVKAKLGRKRSAAKAEGSAAKAEGSDGAQPTADKAADPSGSKSRSKSKADANTMSLADRLEFDAPDAGADEPTVVVLPGPQSGASEKSSGGDRAGHGVPDLTWEPGAAESAFPIADYDKLTEAEVLSLVDELEDDEVAQVSKRERAGRGRSAILQSLASHALSLRMGSSSSAQSSLPIADYESLRVPEILPLLAELDLGELLAVRGRESNGERRSTILNRIDRLARFMGAKPADLATAPVPAMAVAPGPAHRPTDSRRPSPTAPRPAAPAKRSVTNAAPAKRSTAKTPAPAKPSASKRSTAKTPAPAKATAKRSAAPAKRSPAPAKRSSAKTPATAKRSPAPAKATAKRSPAPAKRSTAKRAASAAKGSSTTKSSARKR